LRNERYSIAYVTLAPWTHTALRDALLAGVCKALARRTLVHLHGEGLSELLSGTNIQQCLAQRLLRSTELITATPEAARLGRASGQFARVHRLPNTVPDPVPHVSTAHAVLRCGFLANLDPRKGALRFVDVMEALLGAGLAVTGTLGGTSTNMLSVGDLEELVASRKLAHIVSVLGPLSGSAKARFWSNLDLFVYPSL